MWRKIALICFGLLPPWSLAAEMPLSVRFSNPEYAPLLGEKLRYGGVLSRLVSEVYRRANVTVNYSWYPNNRAIQLARIGEVDGSAGWTPNDDRRRDLLFTDEVLPFRMVLFQRRGENYPWRTLADLSRYRFGITVGNFYSDTFTRLQEKGVLKVDSAGDDVSNLRKLAAGRIDLFPMESEAGMLTTMLHLGPAEATRIVPQDRAYWSTPLCVAISRKSPHAAELVARFNRELKKLRDSGEFDSLLNSTRTEVYAALEHHVR